MLNQMVGMPNSLMTKSHKLLTDTIMDSQTSLEKIDNKEASMSRDHVLTCTDFALVWQFLKGYIKLWNVFKTHAGKDCQLDYKQ